MLDKFKFTPFSIMELNLSKEWELSCHVSSNWLLVTLKIELIHTHTHTQLNLSTHTHSLSLSHTHTHTLLSLTEV